MMTPANPTSVARQFLDQATVFTDAPQTTGDAAAAGDYRAALAQAERLGLAAGQLRQALLRDVLARGAGWQELAGMLGMHPQAAFETCAHLAGHRNTPAQQRPDLAVVLTAGLAAEHEMRGEYGIDIEDLSLDHSLHTEPGVRRVRDAAELVGDDVWITVTIPGDFEGAEGDPAPGIDAIQQWTSVVLHPVELTWLREMLALNNETCE
ncbi:MAG: hypothetical protein ACRDPY_22465 [Streptosporangiaceae bacterium]